MNKRVPDAMIAAVDAAIPLYFSSGVSAFPHVNEAAVVSRFGEDQGRVLNGYIKLLVEELCDIAPTESNLLACTSNAINMLRLRYPLLSAESLEVLAGYYSYAWR